MLRYGTRPYEWGTQYVSMCDATLTAMESLVCWKMVNVLISIWLYVLPFFSSVSETVELSGAVGHSLGEQRLRAKAVKLRESETVKCVEYIDILITWPAPNTRFIFGWDKFKTCNIVENTGMLLFWSIRFPKLLNLFWCFILFVLGISESWILFFPNFLLYVLLTNCLKI